MQDDCIFSLVVGVYGHKQEFSRFLESLYKQHVNFELIIIDQNPEDQIKVMLESKHPSLPWRYFRTSVKGLSHARNIGLEKAKGRYVCFPDDDCFFPKNLLDQVFYFIKTKSSNGLAVITKDPETQLPLSYTKRTDDFFINSNDVFSNITSISVFLKNTDLRFDEEFGIGGDFHSCEEIDFVYRYVFLFGGFNYISSINVYHPSPLKLPFFKLVKKVLVNSQGHGAFFSKNFKFKDYFEHLYLRPIGGFFYHSFKLDFKKSLISLFSLLSRNYGSLRFFMSKVK